MQKHLACGHSEIIRSADVMVHGRNLALGEGLRVQRQHATVARTVDFPRQIDFHQRFDVQHLSLGAAQQHVGERWIDNRFGGYHRIAHLDFAKLAEVDHPDVRGYVAAIFSPVGNPVGRKRDVRRSHLE